MYKYLIILSIILVIHMVFYPYKKYPKEIEINIGSKKITAEVAISPYKQMVGLMFRKSLDINSGMLFIFNKEAKHSFWMANTYIPLDIIWLDKNKEIVYINEDTPSCKKSGFFKSSCTLYTPTKKAIYVLEVNAGLVKENNITIGDKISFDIY